MSGCATKPVSGILSGANRRSRNTVSRSWPVTASTIRPAQSMPMPYCQRVPGSKVSGAVRPASLPVRGAGRPVSSMIAQQLGVPDVVAEAGGVGQQVAQGHRAARRAQPRLAGRVEPLQHLGRGEFLDDLARRLVEREAAVLDELHRRRGGDRLGHRGDAEHRPHVHRRLLGEAAPSERALVDHPLRRGGARHDARYLALLHRTAKNRVDIAHGRCSCRFPGPATVP